MTNKSLTNEQRMLARLERTRDDSSLSEAEACELLKSEGIDVAAEFKLLLSNIQLHHETHRKLALTTAEAAYKDFNAKSQSHNSTLRSRDINMSRIRAHQERSPELTASFRALTHMSDTDLQSLLDELDELADDDEPA